MGAISVIDDDASMRVAIDGLLRVRGFTVHVFASAVDFLRSPRLDETSCVITDLQMPDMSGLDLQERLRCEGRALPIIFVTAFPNEPARTRALRGGAVCFLIKPFTAADLIDCVQRALLAG